MRRPMLILIAVMVLRAHDVLAGPAEARDVARLNNCVPKKVEVYQQKMGAGSQTIYRVACTEPKTVDENAPKMAEAMLVRCDGSLCEMLRPFESSSK